MPTRYMISWMVRRVVASSRAAYSKRYSLTNSLGVRPETFLNLR